MILFALGSGIGFMVLAGIVCDFIFEYIHKAKKIYRQSKFAVCEIGQKPLAGQENSGFDQVDRVDCVREKSINSDLLQKNVHGSKTDLYTVNNGNPVHNEAF